VRRLVPSCVALLAGCAPAASPPPPRLHYLATAEQYGPVSFRDPLGVLSPDGHWLAYSIQQHLYLQPVAGGPAAELARALGVIAHLAWTADSRRVIAEHRSSPTRWWAYDAPTGARAPLWPAGLRLHASLDSLGAVDVAADSLQQLAWSVDGRRIAGVRSTRTGSELWSSGPTGDSARVMASRGRLSFPAYSPDGHVACLLHDGKRQVVSDPCGDRARDGEAPAAYGPVAFSARGDTLYFAAPNPGGALDLWARPARGGAIRLTSFARDAYAPTVARDGGVLFKVQSYRVVVGVVPAAGGPVRVMAGFQSETPSWDPTGKWIGITYGAWRRVVDDYRYPDIAQDVGIIAADSGVPAARPARLVDASPSEDQSLCWSPNGEWIAYHSHKDAGDDVWLVPADGSMPARRLTSFGRGFETGWPRWSPDGKWLAFDANSGAEASSRSVIYVMGLDQGRGATTRPARPIDLVGYDGEAVHAEWLPASDRLAILGEDGRGGDAILVAPREGGRVHVVHQWHSEHKFAGLGISPDGTWAAFIAPAADGHFQLYRIPLAGGAPEQLTFDPSNKTQPSYAPDGQHIALTVWEYLVQFWVLR
jgi:Tol biopolymer transport system component